jgi:DUF971 family protein
MTAPTELRVSKDRRLMTVSFPGHQAFQLPAEMLRVLSPSAEVQGHSPEQRVTVPSKRNRHLEDRADGQLCCQDHLRRRP